MEAKCHRTQCPSVSDEFPLVTLSLASWCSTLVFNLTNSTGHFILRDLERPEILLNVLRKIKEKRKLSDAQELKVFNAKIR